MCKSIRNVGHCIYPVLVDHKLAKPRESQPRAGRSTIILYWTRYNLCFVAFDHECETASVEWVALFLGSERERAGFPASNLRIRPLFPGQTAARRGPNHRREPGGGRPTERLPYFVSGVRAARFFGADWRIDAEQSAWREP